MLPGGQWHVHDPRRPQPVVVAPGAFSTSATPPSDAIMLFNGTNLAGWVDTNGQPAPWQVVDGTMLAKKCDIHTTQQFGDIQLHVEFCEPVPARGSGQGRGNSGVFFMGQFELQVLDCFNSKTYPDGQTAALYGQHPPLANACLPLGEWQTYDAIFTTPRFRGERRLENARAHYCLPQRRGGIKPRGALSAPPTTRFRPNTCPCPPPVPWPSSFTATPSDSDISGSGP